MSTDHQEGLIDRMSTRLDTSPEQRLRNIAQSLRLSERDVDIKSLLRQHGNISAAETELRTLAKRHHGVRPSGILTREERIRKCATALARTPDALDILQSSLRKVLAEPLSERLRKVNISSGPFKERVAARNAASVELLYAVGYEPMHGYLVLNNHDAATLRLALDELEAAKELSTYREGKSQLLSDHARRQAASAESAAANERRAAFLARVPAEPTADDASSTCVITVRSGDTASTRRFGSDNVLDDLLNFCRSLPGTPEVGELVIENVTTRPPRRLDPARQGQDSLYALDLWPIGQVHVRLAEARA